MNNKKLGNSTEQKFLELIQSQGGWATLIPPTHLGQPVDVIAIVHNQYLFVDVKNCSGDRFSLNSIQDNQVLSMQKIVNAHNGYYEMGQVITKIGFMIYFSKYNLWKYLSFGVYQNMKVNNEKSVKFDDDFRLWRVRQ